MTCRQSWNMILVSTVFVKAVKTHRLWAEHAMVRSTCGIPRVYRLSPDVKVTRFTCVYARFYYLVYCVFVILFVILYVRLRISQWQKKIAAWNLHACLTTIWDELIPFWWTLALGSHGGGINSGMSYIELAVGQSELGAVAWWAFRIGVGSVDWPYGGICVL